MNTMMELEIGPGPAPGSYVVHVLQSVGGGQPTQTITLDLDDLVQRRPLLEATVLSSSVSARRVMSDTEEVVQDVGRRLFDSTFSGEVRNAYRTSMAVASERGKGVQIALRLTAPGLAALPWETLFDAESGIYLCRKEPLVRYAPAPHSPDALSIEPPMRILGMVASPRGLPALDVGGERERLEEALRPHLDSGRVVLEWLDDVTWTGVHGKLLEDQWHVLHFVGHGTYDVETDEGVLAFVGRDGRADYVTASSLADLLDEAEPTPRLVVLNSCQSGAGGTTDLFSGTAAALAHSGIRAVAAMQFSISDDAAIEFARGFYTALSHGRGIDEAVRSGRIGILGMGRGTLEWVTPVLYLRGEDTKLFDVAPMPKKAAPTEPVDPLPHAEAVDEAAPTAPPESGDETPAAEPTPEPTAEPTPEPTPEATPEPTEPSPPAPPQTTEPVAEPVPVLGATSEAPWWTKPTPTRSPTSPPGRPAGPPGGTSGSPARPSTPQPPSRPPTRPVSDPRHEPRPTRRWKPWLVVILIAMVAIAGAVTTVSLLRPGSGVEGILTGGTTDPLDPDELGGQPTDAASTGVFVTDKVVSLTPDGWEDGWVYTGIICSVDAEYRITASADGSMHDGTPVGPNGLGEGETSEQGFYEQHPLASLIVGIRGSDTLEFVGTDGKYTCPSESQMKLGINDYLGVENNSGQYNVKIYRLSGQ